MRGVSLCLLLSCVATSTAAASTAWSSLWSTPEQQAQHLLDSRQAAAAAPLFKDPRRRGYAQLRAGQYGQAAKSLAPLHDTDSLYNRGNALAHTGQLRDALAAYDAALEQSPGNHDIVRNRDLVARALQKQQQSSRSQQGSSGSGAGAAKGGQQGQAGGQQGHTGGRQAGGGQQQAHAGGQQAGGSQQQAHAGSHQAGSGEQQAQAGSQQQAHAGSQQAGGSQQQAHAGSQQAGSGEQQGHTAGQQGGAGATGEQLGRSGDSGTQGQQEAGSRARQDPSQTGTAHGVDSAPGTSSVADAGSKSPNAPNAAVQNDRLQGATQDKRPNTAQPPRRSEQSLALDQWLRGIPDDSGELLRRKFMIEHMMKQQENAP